jgi:sucrose phosphorylase
LLPKKGTMKNTETKLTNRLPNGVIFNAYPDSIGFKMADTVAMLKKPEFKNVFSLFYILPTFFNSDLDRGFSVIDYDLNQDLVSHNDVAELKALDLEFKFDLVLNHLSVESPQFQDILKHGENSKFRDFFIDWNEFWQGEGEMGPEGCVIPDQDHLARLFMRKPGLPILKVRFPDGSERPYWNTFYQEITYPEFSGQDFLLAIGNDRLTPEQAEDIAARVNETLSANRSTREIVLNGYDELRHDIIAFVEQNRQYLGQMDLNARSKLVWDFYEETFKKLRDHGGKLIRLDAFAYLHKAPGETNFFNKPGTWEYLDRLRQLARKYDLILLPEIHSEYGTGLHEEVAAEGFPIYDFFFPGLVIHALDNGSNTHLLKWIDDILSKGIQTVNMLGCHDGIPVLDLRGKSSRGLMSDEEIDTVMHTIMQRGGRVKNLYGPDGKKISYYQVNATFFSALGEDQRKLLLARALQLFMPGIPQVWYLDLFAGKNDYAAADLGGPGGHKEINRTTLTNRVIEQRLKQKIVKDQLELLRLRNTNPAFNGKLTVESPSEHTLNLSWKNADSSATLVADLKTHDFQISQVDADGNETTKLYNQPAAGVQ